MYLPPRCLHEWWHWLGRPLLAASVEVLGVPGAVWSEDGLLHHAAPLLNRGLNILQKTPKKVNVLSRKKIADNREIFVININQNESYKK